MIKALLNQFIVFKIAIYAGFKFVLRYTRVFLPFILIALANGVGLLAAYLLPLHPFSRIFGALITDVYGRQYLHYPYNFMILSELFSQVKNFIVNPFVAGVMITAAAGMVYDYYFNREPTLLRNLNRALRRFIHVFLIMLSLAVVTFGIYYTLPLVIARLNLAPQLNALAVYAGGFVLSVAVESFFVYAFIIIIFRKQNFLSAIKNSFLFAFRFYPATFLLVLLPRLLDFGAGLLHLRQEYLMERFLPDIILGVIGLGILIAIVSDCLVYVFASNLYMLMQKAEFEHES